MRDVHIARSGLVCLAPVVVDAASSERPGIGLGGRGNGRERLTREV